MADHVVNVDERWLPNGNNNRKNMKERLLETNLKRDGHGQKNSKSTVSHFRLESGHIMFLKKGAFP